MLPREFVRRIAAHREHQKAMVEREEHRFYNMLNAFGSVMAGKKWTWQSPSREPSRREDLNERFERAYARHLARRRRWHSDSETKG